MLFDEARLPDDQYRLLRKHLDRGKLTHAEKRRLQRLTKKWVKESLWELGLLILGVCIVAGFYIHLAP